jgi:membrane-associated phospholipid phosphatase
MGGAAGGAIATDTDGPVEVAPIVRVSGGVRRAWGDVVLYDRWPLGEPQFGLAAAAAIAAVLAFRRNYRSAAVVLGGFVLMSAVQLVIVVTLAEFRHDGLGVAALVRLYPSGHTARVPFLGTAVAAMADPRVRWWILGATAVLAITVALDRTDSKIQTGSIVVGGLLLGIAASLWFVALVSAWKAESVGRIRK